MQVEESQVENGNCADSYTNAVLAFNFIQRWLRCTSSSNSTWRRRIGFKGQETKKDKPISDTFEIQQHIDQLDSDFEAIKNKKRRTIKNLKRQRKGTLKDAERETRQQSWTDFAKIGKKRKDLKESSIWSTTTQAGVGIVATTKAGYSRVTDILK